MDHQCHAHGCKKPVPPKMFACREHWYALSKKLRDAIWREYQTGQERTKKVTWRYMAVQRLAVAELAFLPKNEAAALTSARYMLDAERYRQRAIAEGDGDPLDGLVPEPDPQLKLL